MSNNTCLFCHLPDSRIITSSQLALVIRDAYPVSLGHTLIIPKRHIGSFFETTTD
jgi:diadenosine tetraphosphate (Ap4A) HIT family hydrolase